MDFKILPFELKSAGDGSTFAGYCNCFNNIDSAQEIVAPGAFTDALDEFMATGFIGGLNHNWDSPIGKPMSAKEDIKGLFVEGKISPTQHGKDVMVLLKDDVIKRMSIGYRVSGDQMLKDAEEVAAYWKDVGYTPNAKDIAASQYGARLLTKIKPLFEFSPVTVAANTLADITRVKRYAAGDIGAEEEIETYLRDVRGFSQKASKIVVSGIKALYQRDVEEAVTTPEAETPPAEPEPITEAATEETTVETKTEVEPIIEVPPSAVVVIDVSKGAHQYEVQGLYANLLDIKAKYGLGAP